MRVGQRSRQPGAGVSADWRIAMRPYRVCVVALVAALAACHTTGIAAHDAFSARVQRYVSLRHEAVAAVGPREETSDARELVRAGDALAARIRALRRDARQGALFGPPVAGAIRSALRTRLERDERPLARVRDVQPHRFEPRVNAIYPRDEPLPSMPASWLRALPPLPPHLSYRLVGADLLLLDDTRLIVDVLPDAIALQR